MYDFKEDSIGTKFIPNFIQIRLVVLELIHANRRTEEEVKRQTDIASCTAFIPYISCKYRIKM
jgi:hypothetical protein